LRHSGQVVVEVGDTGAGMSEDFVQNQLFRPFSTTKHSGMGIGSFESLQYVRELGGSITVTSAVGRGTLMTVLLPLFEVQTASDLHRSEAPL
jgi:signal transduction histidine kinase